MEIQTSERRNSEYTLIESQRELGSQGQQLLEAHVWLVHVRRVVTLVLLRL